MLRLHPSSLVVGALGAVVVFVCMSQITMPVSFPSGRFQFGPHPRDFVRIQEGTPYTVPAGKVLVLTAVGRTAIQSNQTATVSVNGQVVDGAAPVISTAAPCSMKTVPAYSIARAGDVVTAFGNLPQPTTRVLGFLVDDAPTLSPGTVRPSLDLRPHPQDAFAVVEGTIFVVPQGMLCVVTGLGVSAPGLFQQTYTRLIADGQEELQVLSGDDAGSGLVSIPAGFVYGPGTVLQVDANDPNFTGRALCYLAAQ